MIPRVSTGLRMCSVLLLVLMVSPITAPFSTCDLFDLLGGSGSSGAAVLQAKTGSDDPVPGLGARFSVPAPQLSDRPYIDVAEREPGRRALRHTPLRI